MRSHSLFIETLLRVLMYSRVTWICDTPALVAVNKPYRAISSGKNDKYLVKTHMARISNLINLVKYKFIV